MSDDLNKNINLAELAYTGRSTNAVWAWCTGLRGCVLVSWLDEQGRLVTNLASYREFRTNALERAEHGLHGSRLRRTTA